MKKAELYPKINEMPYHNTKVEAEKTKAQIILLLEKYGIENHQWTKLEGNETLKFMIDTIVQGKRIKQAVQLDLPNIKALKGRYQDLVDIPKNQLYRMFFYSLKSILESTKYGLMKKEDLLMSYILTQLPDGRTVQMKELLAEHPLLLQQGEL